MYKPIKKEQQKMYKKFYYLVCLTSCRNGKRPFELVVGSYAFYGRPSSIDGLSVICCAKLVKLFVGMELAG